MKVCHLSNIPSPPAERFLASLNSTVASSASSNKTAATSAALFATVVFVGVLITVAVSCVIQFVLGVKESKKSDQKREVRREAERRTTVSSTDNILLPSTSSSSPIQNNRVCLPQSEGSLRTSVTPTDQYYQCNYNDAPRLEELPKTASPDDLNYDVARRAAEARRKAAFQAARQMDDITNGRAHTARTGPWLGRRPRQCGSSAKDKLPRDEAPRYVSSL